MLHPPDADTSAAELVRLHNLRPHPEGGWFRETFRDAATDSSGRSRSTAIYFLLEAHERSARHRVDASEVWHHYAGASLELTIEHDGQVDRIVLGDRIADGQRPQAVVPAGAWQWARPLGGWVLVGCTVAPAFELDGFELEAEP